jgi:LacI family transcriptional regulator
MKSHADTNIPPRSRAGRAFHNAVATASTIKDVAHASGVSIGTVSNVFNDRTALVRPETRRRVLDAARSLNYRPSAAARSLVQGRTRTVGVLFHTRTGIVTLDPYASGVLQGILSGAVGVGYGVLLYPEPWRGPEQAAGMLANRNADGILVVAPRLALISEMMPLGVPLAVVSARPDAATRDAAAAPLVAADVDNTAGGRMATEHLLSLGHRHIAHLVGDTFQSSAFEREAGYRAALHAAGIEPRPDYRVVCGYGGEEGYEATRALLALPTPPTAIFAANDRLAAAALQAARDADVPVPDRLSLVGFDDLPVASHVTPPLTTIRQPLARIGAAAVELLVARLEGEADTPGVADGASWDSETGSLLFAPDLIVRGSTAPPPATRD